MKEKKVLARHVERASTKDREMKATRVTPIIERVLQAVQCTAA